MKHYAFELDGPYDGLNSLGMFSCINCPDGSLKIAQSENGSTTFMNTLFDWTLLHCMLGLFGELYYQSCVIQRPVFDNEELSNSSFLYSDASIKMGAFLCTLPLTPDMMGRNCLSDISYPTSLHFFQSSNDGLRFMQSIRESPNSNDCSARNGAYYYSMHLHGNDYIDKMIVISSYQNMQILKNLLSLQVFYGAKTNQADFLNMTCPGN